MQAIFWNVRLNNKLIDQVPYDADCNREYVYNSLVNHDGYDPAIKVTKQVIRGKKAKYNFMVNNSVYFSKLCTEKQAQKHLNAFFAEAQAMNNSPIPLTIKYVIAE